jgi:UDP-N-acetylglucosamine--N-acetylmuramyl-(pentapeptide) pyrophosphoryl-undecaprenol N-acetylglucosamine transferase
MMEQLHKRVIISGGGTGGHIFPAISIANALKRIDGGYEILFVGAEGRMEMERVPLAGYPIVGLPVTGFIRGFSLRNFSVVTKLIRSIIKAKKIISEFKPDVVVGVGGYASGPVLRVAGRRGIPTLIQEQNSYAGITNRLLGKRAKTICVAYDGMERFFPKNKIIFTGNPVRRDIADLVRSDDSGYNHFGLKKGTVLLVLGGSLGSRTINNTISDNLKVLTDAGLQVLWQTGKYYYNTVKEIVGDGIEGVKVVAFIDRMDLAYSIADIIVSRAGAGTISELCLVAKPVILIPSPNVSEDHQTSNARALSEKGAAIMVKDSEASKILAKTIVDLIGDSEKIKRLSEEIGNLAIIDSDIRIATEVKKLAL